MTRDRGEGGIFRSLSERVGLRQSEPDWRSDPRVTVVTGLSAMDLYYAEPKVVVDMLRRDFAGEEELLIRGTMASIRGELREGNTFLICDVGQILETGYDDRPQSQSWYSPGMIGVSRFNVQKGNMWGATSGALGDTYLNVQVHFPEQFARYGKWIKPILIVYEKDQMPDYLPPDDIAPRFYVKDFKDPKKVVRKIYVFEITS